MILYDYILLDHRSSQRGMFTGALPHAPPGVLRARSKGTLGSRKYKNEISAAHVSTLSGVPDL